MKALETLDEHTPTQDKKDGKYYFFFCPDLDLLVVAKTREEAEIKIKEDLRMLLARCSKYYN